ncbi:MAG: OsmC family protein [Gemmatimonadales bacterium]
MPRTIAVDVHQVGPSTSEGRARHHRLLIDRPEAKGGADRGPLGGELLLLSLGGCFMSTLLAAIRAREANVSNLRIEVVGTVEESPDRYTAIAMAVHADYDDADLARKLLTIAENGCLVTSTLKQALAVTCHLAS